MTDLQKAALALRINSMTREERETLYKEGIATAIDNWLTAYHKYKTKNAERVKRYRNKRRTKCSDQKKTTTRNPKVTSKSS